ncbi:MAG: agmatinase [Comamonadaceae bacterium]|nr:MAG: agmatinase [Comamonadaceae bacterium]
MQADSLKSLCGGPMTFMGVPFSHDLSGARAAILGLPFDCGIHAFRVGARSGPRAIREQSRLIRAYNPELADYNPMQRLGLVDCGDVNLTPGMIGPAFERIEAAVGQLVQANVVPITLGGDGSVSHPQLRALARRYPDLAVIHLDSHTDTNPPTPESLHNAGTQFHYAATEKLVDTSATYHIGLRGTTTMPNGFARTRALGYDKLITMNDVMQRGMDDVLQQLQAQLKGRPVYLCLDMDVFDPSCAPGVCAPSWGGFSAREGMAFLRGLDGLNIVAADINTVSPPHDVGGMTAFLAAALIDEILVLLCKHGGLDAPAVSP